MFMGPYDLGGDWSDKGIVGVDRFVQRTYSIFEDYKNKTPNEIWFGELEEFLKQYRKRNGSHVMFLKKSPF